jgi:succinate-semialdehyde dehydrogenase/glutarate-semialdehyde dehydrogenase
VPEQRSVCIAAKRFIVHTDVYDQFVDPFVAHLFALTVGDPMLDTTDVGPLATRQGREDVEAQVADAAGKGATVRCGGKAPAGDGWWYPPTVVTDITPDMRMFTEEVFGPVAGVCGAGSLDEAVDLAKATSYGLDANAWTEDPQEQQLGRRQRQHRRRRGHRVERRCLRGTHCGGWRPVRRRGGVDRPAPRR